eukprot:CAMPEP_0181179448 /NCGR_PEP_ID=MMETSP1096-20121128/6266_1 /TAXON_ID=156174 ORGANISM="Chrysochromulina ericina, Strain CCMP281" /NCGR_SAMPLE_ID=MMETSP1096 /ASSEMBLY_ACC=CAM_ASM_000453 /LENGTH=160 /DNA_ID=CAMNT_0023267799 /DNA_START=439 /DNA_END=921 /DNA_ORIENTATION=-
MHAYPHCPAHVMILSRSIHVFKDGGALRVMMTRYMALESFAGRTVSEVDIPFWPLSNAYPHCPVHVLLAPGLLPSVSSLQLALAQKISHRRLHVLCEIAMEGDHVGVLARNRTSRQSGWSKEAESGVASAQQSNRLLRMIPASAVKRQSKLLVRKTSSAD